MKIAVVGVGAIGGIYGGLLANVGHDVHFLLHSDFDHVQRNGLRIDSVLGDFQLPQVNAYQAAADMPQCDVVIVALKTTANMQLAPILDVLLKPETTLLLLQNGLGAEEFLAQHYPNNSLLSGLCFICCSKIGPGHILHLDQGAIRLGEYNPQQEAGITPKMRDIAELFANTGISIHFTPNLLQARWEKLVWNIPFNGLSVVLQQSTQGLLTDRHCRDLLVELMEEVISAANHCGFTIQPSYAQVLLHATDKMADYQPSMLLDYQNKRPLELESIYWEPIRTAAERGFDMAKTRVIAQQLAFLDQKNSP